ncbi:MAG: nucleotidyltransferase domain-containing protein [bacterium]|nr:nucleotidyltransferase domain-containing protein [bacterium]
MTAFLQSEPVLDRLVARLASDDRCQIIILYGSRARGDAGLDSDYDVVGFRDEEGPPVRQTGMQDGALLDVFIYPLRRLSGPCTDMLHVRGGRTLRDRDGQGAAFLARLDDVFAAGPEPLSPDEILARRNWAWKMLDRASRGDLEGNFRRAWLLTTQLENYFVFRNEWYLGSKAGLRTLEADQPEIYAVMEHALRPAASLDEIEALVLAVNGARS